MCTIVGYGGIGKATGRLMQAVRSNALGSQHVWATEDPVDFAGTLEDLDRALLSRDVVVVSASPDTDHVGAHLRARARPYEADVILVNVRAGTVIDQRALYDHLRDNPEFWAGIDTWWSEPRGSGRVPDRVSRS